ncbi:MAG: GFA family protein [Sulfuricellaceae bacterium]|nr:GFA family protein [Sulfuricellaceae bacterium]
MHRGSCLCRTVTYQVKELGDIVYCHCSQCRKAGGSAFAAVSPIDSADFHLLSGQDALAEFETGPGIARVFCRHCGSPLYSKRAFQPELLRLRIGSLDTPVEKRVSAHIFVGSKADWDEICDLAPQYAERP